MGSKNMKTVIIRGAYQNFRCNVLHQKLFIPEEYIIMFWGKLRFCAPKVSTKKIVFVNQPCPVPWTNKYSYLGKRPHAKYQISCLAKNMLQLFRQLSRSNILWIFKLILIKRILITCWSSITSTTFPYVKVMSF